jgi:hypothetical protein
MPGSRPPAQLSPNSRLAHSRQKHRAPARVHRQPLGRAHPPDAGEGDLHLDTTDLETALKELFAGSMEAAGIEPANDSERVSESSRLRRWPSEDNPHAAGRRVAPGVGSPNLETKNLGMGAGFRLSP